MAIEIKFLADEHVDIDITRGLRARGVDVLTVQEAGLAHTDDALILAFGLEHDRVIFTQDADFLAWHQRGVPHAGIAYVHQQASIGTVVRGLLLIHEMLTAEEIRGKVEFL